MAKKSDVVAESVEAFADVVEAGDFFDRLAGWMRDNGVKNPREVPDAVVESLGGGN